MPPFLTVRFFRTATGREPVRDWLKDEVSEDARRAIGADIKTVQLGWPLGMPLVRKIDGDLWEVRCNIPGGIARVLFTLSGAQMVLLHGFVKKSQSISATDLALAKRRKKEVDT